MSLDEAYKLLGVSEAAGFDEILAAKKKLVRQSGNDRERIVQVEAAYDILLMQSMKRRMSGDVGSAVRFADVKRARSATKAEPGLLQRLPVQVSPASQDTLLQLTGVSAALAAWSLAQGLAEPPGMGRNDIPGLQLALAVGATTYLLRDRKRLSLQRAGGLAVAGLVLGTLLGSALQSWLRVDIIPIFGLGSPGVFVSEWAILSLWAVGAFLA
ncbi:hypothetical protein WJX81_004315 [Elliptochloris bilobata]|uniref:Molecular chaperone DnaJ n=1 Tax=Elliptochloris bilobata TaxID=381761 RepID=A0AAW1RR82_9CHLO